MADENVATSEEDKSPNRSSDGFREVPIEVMVSVGKAYPPVGELLQLENNSVLTLDQKIDDPVELYVGSKLIARGELQELEGDETGKIVVRLTHVVMEAEQV